MEHFEILMATFLLSLIIVAPSLAMLARVHAETRDKIASSFYEGAQKIIKHEAATPFITALTIAIGESLSHPKMIRRFCFQWLAGRLATDSRVSARFSGELNAAPEDLRLLVRSTVALGLFGTTFSSVLAGGLVRRFLFRPIGMPKERVDCSGFINSFYREPNDHDLKAA